MDYKTKYLKYKLKYLELKNNQIGGQINKYEIMDKKIKEITNFIETKTKNEIKEKLLELINISDFCKKILGQGRFGKVYVPEIDTTYPYKIGKKKIELPIVIKEIKKVDNPESIVNLEIIEDTLYISGYDNITTEMLILLFVRKLYNKTVHLPLILGYGTCSKSNMVDRIFTLKYGLDYNYSLDLSKRVFNEIPLWNKINKSDMEKFNSNLATLKDLFIYIHYNQEDNNYVKLPNGIKCEISELYDNFCISYLATHELLSKNNIFTADAHSANIFIHWLNDKSYFKDKCIKDVKEIIYKINNTYYKIKTFGFVMIIGDMGMSTLKIRDDIILIGHACNLKQNFNLVNKLMNPRYNNIDFITKNKDILTINQFKNTIAYKILNSKPYMDYPFDNNSITGRDVDYIKKLKSNNELLEYYYPKYGLKKYKKNNNQILIDID